jgi:hypothetical protein
MVIKTRINKILASNNQSLHAQMQVTTTTRRIKADKARTTAARPIVALIH